MVPGFLKKHLYRFYLQKIKKEHFEKFSRREREIPLFLLENKHLCNLKALPNRKELLKRLPSEAVVAEIGVDNGTFSKMIQEYCDPKKLHLIDVWNSDRYNNQKKNTVYQKFQKNLDSGQVKIHEGYSTEMVKHFKDSYFDWIYIDTDHSYGTTINELNLYAPKMKKEGVICGHDYVVGYWNGLAKFGVIEAVHEFCVVNNWEFVYLTMETREHRSFAIKKIK